MRREAAWCVLAACLCLVGACEASANVKWGQDREHLFVTVGPDCSSEYSSSFLEDYLRVKCRGADGSDYGMDLQLREDIVPVDSTCKMVKNEMFCTLAKRLPHMFDRLARDANALGGSIKRDWRRWKAEDEEEEMPDPYEGVSEDIVRRLTSKQLEELVWDKQTKLVVADLSHSWCTSSVRAKQLFIAAATKLSSPSVIFVRVDSKEHPNVARHYDIGCGLQQHVYLIRRGGGLDKLKKVDSEEIVVPSQESELISAIRSRFEAKLVHITTEKELEEFKKSFKVVALGVLKPSWGASVQSMPEYEALVKAATITRGLVAVGYSDAPLAGYSGNALKLFKSGREEDQDLSLVPDGAALARMIGAEAFPTMSVYDYGLRETFDRIAMPIIQVFGQERDFLKMAEQVARKFRGRLGMVRMAPHHYYMLEDFGKEKGEVPAVGITDSFHWNSMKYSHPGDMTFESVQKTVEQYLAGTLAPTFKSERPPHPDDYQRGKIKKVVKNTLHSVIGEGASEDTLIMVFRPWMHSLRKSQDIFKKVAEAFTQVDNVTVASLDVSSNFFDKEIWRGMREMEEDPCVYLCPKGGGSCHKYYGDISQKEIFQFAAKHSHHIKSQWEDKVKPQLKEMKRRDQVLKEEAGKDSARRAVEYAESVLEFNRKIEFADEVEIAAGVSKRVAVRGDEDREPPMDNERVVVHYTGTLAKSGKKFDSSRDKGKPFKFTMGIGQVIPCWEKGVKSMTAGERARLTCHYEQAYGEAGMPPTIPEKSELHFDIELISHGPINMHDEM